MSQAIRTYTTENEVSALAYHTVIPQFGIELHDFTRIDSDFSNGGVDKPIHKRDGHADTVTLQHRDVGQAVLLTNDTDWDLPVGGTARYFTPGTITRARQLIGLRTDALADYMEVVEEDRYWTNPGLSGRAMSAVEHAIDAGLPLDAVPERIRHLARQGAHDFTRQALAHASEGKADLAEKELLNAYETMSDLEEEFAFATDDLSVTSFGEAVVQLQDNLTDNVGRHARGKKEKEAAAEAVQLAQSIERSTGAEIFYNGVAQDYLGAPTALVNAD